MLSELSCKMSCARNFLLAVLYSYLAVRCLMIAACISVLMGKGDKHDIFIGWWKTRMSDWLLLPSEKVAETYWMALCWVQLAVSALEILAIRLRRRPILEAALLCHFVAMVLHFALLMVYMNWCSDDCTLRSLRHLQLTFGTFVCELFIFVGVFGLFCGCLKQGYVVAGESRSGLSDTPVRKSPFLGRRSLTESQEDPKVPILMKFSSTIPSPLRTEDVDDYSEGGPQPQLSARSTWV